MGRLRFSIFGGGLTAKMGLVGKFSVDVVGRPFANQLSKMGTGRQSEFQWDKLGYDIATRAITFGIPKPWKSFARGITRGGWDAYMRGLIGNNQVTYLYMV